MDQMDASLLNGKSSQKINSNKMIFAQVLRGVVYNTIVVEDLGLIPIFSIGYDNVIDITNLPNRPSIGATYDGNIFTPSINLPQEDLCPCHA